MEATLRAHSPRAGPRARLGAVSFVHRFGSALNAHVHFHCCVLDEVFEAQPVSDGQVMFREAVELSPQAVAAVQAQVRRRVLRWFVRRGWLAEEDRQGMQSWDHSGGMCAIPGAHPSGALKCVPFCSRQNGLARRGGPHRGPGQRRARA